MAVFFRYLVNSPVLMCTVAKLDKSIFTGYQKNRAMFNWLPCIFFCIADETSSWDLADCVNYVNKNLEKIGFRKKIKIRGEKRKTERKGKIFTVLAWGAKISFFEMGKVQSCHILSKNKPLICNVKKKKSTSWYNFSFQNAMEYFTHTCTVL